MINNKKIANIKCIDEVKCFPHTNYSIIGNFHSNYVTFVVPPSYDIKPGNINISDITKIKCYAVVSNGKHLFQIEIQCKEQYILFSNVVHPERIFINPKIKYIKFERPVPLKFL